MLLQGARRRGAAGDRLPSRAARAAVAAAGTVGYVELSLQYFEGV